MRLKKYSIIALLLIVAMIIVFTLGNKTGVVTQEKIKIGATLPLTGQLAMYGEAYRNGAILAAEEIRNIELVIMDNKGDAKTAVKDVNYLINVVDVPAILNSMEYLTLASKDLAEKNERIMISFTIYILDGSDDYIFRDAWDFRSIGKKFADYLNRINASRIAIIGQSDEGYNHLKDALQEKIAGNIIAEHKFNYGERDFRTTLVKIRNEHLDTVVVYAYPAEARAILSQMAELGMDDYNVVTTEGTESFVMQGNEDFLESTNAVSYLGSRLTEVQFTEKYRARFGEHPRPDSLYSYETVIMLSEAITVCGQDTVCILEEIEEEFDQDHNKQRDLPLVRYDDGWNII